MGQAWGNVAGLGTGHCWAVAYSCLQCQAVAGSGRQYQAVTCSERHYHAVAGRGSNGQWHAVAASAAVAAAAQDRQELARKNWDFSFSVRMFSSFRTLLDVFGCVRRFFTKEKSFIGENYYKGPLL